MKINNKYSGLMFMGIGIIAGVTAVYFNVLIKTISTYENAILIYSFIGILFIIISFLLNKYQPKLTYKKHGEFP